MTRQEPIELVRRLAQQHAGVAGSDGSRSIVGLIGRGIRSSRTPRMHEQEASRLGLGYAYVLIDFDALGLPDDEVVNVVKAAMDAGYQGLNVTHPFKQSVMSALDRLSAEAQAIGAVNTIVFADGMAIGHNTDSWGFAQSFRNTMREASLERVTLIGAGGAGAAIAHALLQLGAGTLSIFDRDRGRASDLVTHMTAHFPARVWHVDDVREAVLTAQGIVNATPVGMAKYPGTPFPTDLLSPRQWLADIIYFPTETELLRQAALKGCRTLPGIGMAIHQAVRAFALFTGREADPEAMTVHFEAAA